MNYNATSLLYDVAIMSALLFAGKVIRTKVKIVQKMYIPAALIAGFLGLFLGSQFLNILPFSNQISSYSGILIAVVFGSMFIGNKRSASFKSMFKNVGDTFLVNAAAEIGQYAFFILLGVTVLPLVFSNIN